MPPALSTFVEDRCVGQVPAHRHTSWVGHWGPGCVCAASPGPQGHPHLCLEGVDTDFWKGFGILLTSSVTLSDRKQTLRWWEQMIMEVAVGTQMGYIGESQNVGETWDLTMRLFTSLCANWSNLSVKLFAGDILHCKCYKMFLSSKPTPHTLVICTKKE